MPLHQKVRCASTVAIGVRAERIIVRGIRLFLVTQSKAESQAMVAEIQGKAEYDERVDLFSLGVLAFELWCPFGTAMERILTLKELRLRGEAPAAFRAAHPQVPRAAPCGTPGTLGLAA